MIKDYIYSFYNRVKISARNLSIKLEAIRQNQDQILALKDSGEKLFKENQDLAKSIDQTIDSIKSYESTDISSIEDIGGLKKLVSDLQETATLAKKSIDDTKKHKKSIEELANDAEKAVEKIDKSEKEQLAAVLDELAEKQKEKFEKLETSDSTISVLHELESNAERIKAEAQKRIQELEIQEKDDVADQQPDTAPQKAVAECENKEICNIQSVEISDKAGRKLSYPPKEPTNSSDTSENTQTPPIAKNLYVIVGDKEGFEEHINIQAQGKCKSDSACPQVNFSGGSINEEAVGTLSNIEIKSEKVIPEQSWADFIRKIIVPDMDNLSRPQIYDVNAHQCDVQDKVAGLKVIAVPPVGWSGNAKIAYKMKSDEEKAKIAEENAEKGIDKAKALGEWEFGGGIKAYLDKKEVEYKPPESFLKCLQDGMNKITPMFSEIENQYATVTVQWPNVEIDGKVDLVEHPDSHLLNYSGEINLKAQPLLKIDCNVDIKAIILHILAKHELFSDYMMEILKKVEKGVGTDDVKFSGKIEILLKTTAEISGDLRWHRTKEDGIWQVDAAKSSIGGSLGVELYGAIHIEGRVFFVRAAAGASISGRSADGKEKCTFGIRWSALEGAENPALERELYFNGLGIYYSKYAELGTDDTDAGKAVQQAVKRARAGQGGDKANENQKESSNNLLEAGSKELKALCVLMNKWTSRNEVAELGKDEL